MKATGQGVAFGLSNFAVSLKPQEPAELLWLAEGRTADWRLGDAHSDDDYAGAVLNIHPALLPKFGGAGYYGDRVHRAVLEAGESTSG